MENSDKTLGKQLEELMASRNISIEKLADISNVPKRYLIAMIEDDIDRLPAPPYARGYINKIAVLFDVDPFPLYEAFGRSGSRAPGKNDHLPSNRFATLKDNKRFAVVGLGIITLIIVIIVGSRINSLLGIPYIEVNLPEKVGANSFLETGDHIISIEGNINPKDSLSINNEAVAVDSSGHFRKEVVLSSGINTFELTVKHFLGKEKTITRQVFYNDQTVQTIQLNAESPTPAN